MTINIPHDAERVDAICDQLTAAKAGWLNALSQIPEVRRTEAGALRAGVSYSLGKTQPPGIHRAWVLLDGEHRFFPSVWLRLIRLDDGRWVQKGVERPYARDGKAYGPRQAGEINGTT